MNKLESKSVNPYVVIKATSNRLHLQLNTVNRGIHLFTVGILPICIVLLIAVSAYWLVKKDSTATVWPLLIVLPAPILMTMVPAWTDIIASPGSIEVQYRKFFRTEVRKYQLRSDIRITTRFQKAYRTSGWLFLLEDTRGNSSFLFSIPSLPYKSRTVEKENLLQVLNHYCQIENTD